MDKRITYIIFFLLFLPGILLLSGCEEETPDYVMPRQEMIPVIKDLQIAYAGVDATIGIQEEKEKKYDEMNHIVLEKHKMDKERFFKSFQWYEKHPALMDSIYTQVIDELSRDLDPLQQSGGKRINEGTPPAN